MFAPDEALPDLSQYGKGPMPVAAAALPEPEPVAAAPSLRPPWHAGHVRKFPGFPGRAKPRPRGIDASSLAGSGVGGRVMEADVLAAGGAAQPGKATPRHGA